MSLSRTRRVFPAVLHGSLVEFEGNLLASPIEGVGKAFNDCGKFQLEILQQNLKGTFVSSSLSIQILSVKTDFHQSKPTTCRVGQRPTPFVLHGTPWRKT